MTASGRTSGIRNLDVLVPRAFLKMRPAYGTHTGDLRDNLHHGMCQAVSAVEVCAGASCWIEFPHSSPERSEHRIPSYG